VLLLLGAFVAPASGSQETPLPAPETAAADSASVHPDTEFPIMESVEETPRNVLIPLPIISYAPETKLALGASVVYIYRTGEADASSRPSTFGALGIYTLNSQVLAALGGEHYWDEDRQKFTGGLFYQKFPNDFYGIGNDTDADFSETYSDEGTSFSADYIREVIPRIRLGGGVSFGGSSITGTDPGDLLSGDLIPGSGGGQIVGAGLSVSYDSRKNISYPLSAGFYGLSWRLYDKALGGDFSLNTTTLDLRQYIHLGAKRVLAFRGLANFGAGDVPFQIMPVLGGDTLMRGYFAGRFRERKLLAMQAEFRGYVWRRLGGAVFGGLGQVAHETGQLGIDRFHYSYGFGLRFLLIEQEGMNLRADFGIGSDQSGFYLGFGEAF
jgi:outer membrane protein assembly factor BamA